MAFVDGFRLMDRGGQSFKSKFWQTNSFSISMSKFLWPKGIYEYVSHSSLPWSMRLHAGRHGETDSQLCLCIIAYSPKLLMATAASVDRLCYRCLHVQILGWLSVRHHVQYGQ